VKIKYKLYQLKVRHCHLAIPFYDISGKKVWCCRHFVKGVTDEQAT
jgi:hypothetical protein